MADGPYRHFGAGAGQQPQHYYYQQGHSGPPRHITRTGSPVGNNRNIYSSDTPSPSRSPVSQAPAHPFAMFNQGQAAQNSMMNGGGGGRGFMQMNLGHKYQQHQSHQGQPHHHNHHPQQQQHGGHPGHNSMGHHHTFSGGLNSNQGFNAPQNGALQEDQNEVGEQYPEHWQRQMQLLAESRQTTQAAHKHSRKGGATLAVSKGSAQSQTDESSRQGEQIERNRPTINDEPRQDWDGLDMSGQGLRSLTTRLFHDYSFLTKLFVDNNKLTVLPYAISSLRNLTHLQASSNQLRELPDSIGMLSKLEQLLVFDNRIQTLPNELGYLFKLEMLGIEGNPLDDDTRDFLVQNGTQALVTHMRDNTEPGTPPASRPIVIVDDTEAKEKFSVMDYNILCNRYATRTQYKYTPAKALEWEYRRDLILGEIKALDADIVCLQEVDQENYHEFFRRELAMGDYKGIFWPKSRARTMTESEAKLVDGCAIFYKSQKFICLDKQLIDFGNTAINRPDMKGEHDIFNRIMPRDHIAVIAFFENRMTGARLIVVNAHIYWDPKYDDVKLVQTAILLDQTARFADKWATMPACTDKALYRHSEQDNPDGDPDGTPDDAPAPPELAPSQTYASGSQIPLVVCGDFNSARDTGVYELLSQGGVGPDHPDLARRSYGRFTRDGIAHPFKLRSAYNGADDARQYLEFTNYTPGFSGCIEYIWHAAPSLRCRRLLGNVDFDYLQKVPGFPNFHFPSDHIPLYAEFAVEPRKERKVVEADFGN